VCAKAEGKYMEYKITAKVPKKLHSLLEDLSKFVGVSIEEILTEEMEGVLECFIQGGYYDAWVEIALREKGIDC